VVDCIALGDEFTNAEDEIPALCRCTGGLAFRFLYLTRLEDTVLSPVFVDLERRAVSANCAIFSNRVKLPYNERTTPQLEAPGLVRHSLEIVGDAPVTDFRASCILRQMAKCRECFGLVFRRGDQPDQWCVLLKVGALYWDVWVQFDEHYPHACPRFTVKGSPNCGAVKGERGRVDMDALGVKYHPLTAITSIFGKIRDSIGVDGDASSNGEVFPHVRAPYSDRELFLHATRITDETAGHGSGTVPEFGTYTDVTWRPLKEGDGAEWRKLGVDGKLAIGFETMVGVTVNWRTIDVTH